MLRNAFVLIKTGLLQCMQSETATAEILGCVFNHLSERPGHQGQIRWPGGLQRMVNDLSLIGQRVRRVRDGCTRSQRGGMPGVTWRNTRHPVQRISKDLLHRLGVP